MCDLGGAQILGGVYHLRWAAAGRLFGLDAHLKTQFIFLEKGYVLLFFRHGDRESRADAEKNEKRTHNRKPRNAPYFLHVYLPPCRWKLKGCSQAGHKGHCGPHGRGKTRRGGESVVPASPRLRIHLSAFLFPSLHVGLFAMSSRTHGRYIGTDVWNQPGTALRHEGEPLSKV